MRQQPSILQIECLLYLLVILLLSCVGCSKQVTESDELKQAGANVMNEFNDMSWYAPLFAAFQKKILSYRKAKNIWPKSSHDCSEIEPNYIEYVRSGVSIRQKITELNASFKLLKTDDSVAVYEYSFKGMSRTVEIENSLK